MVSIVLHGVVILVLLGIYAAGPPFDGIGTRVHAVLTADLAEEDHSPLPEFVIPPIAEPPPIPEPRLPDPLRLSPPPLPEPEDILEDPGEAGNPSEVPELPLRVVGLKLRPKKAPVSESRPAPPPRRVAVHVPPPRPVAPRLPRASRPRSSTGSGGRLQPVFTPLNYPPEARRLGLEGRARVEMTIGADGTVLDVRLVTSTGHASLDRAALASARQWRFRPPGRIRRAVQPFRFTLG